MEVFFLILILQTGDILQKKIRVRPNRAQLIQRHILQGKEPWATDSLNCPCETAHSANILKKITEAIIKVGPLSV